MSKKYRYEPLDPVLDRPKNIRIGMKDELDWIKRQLEYFNFTEKYRLCYNLKKGEIYEFDWGINVNAEFSNRHYGVVLKDSDEKNPLVMVCPLKTNHNGAHPKSDVDIGFVKELNSTKSSIAVINQIRTLDKLRLFTKHAIGRADGSRGFSDIERENEDEEKSVLRLENYKVELIINSYCLFLLGDKNDKE